MENMPTAPLPSIEQPPIKTESLKEQLYGIGAIYEGPDHKMHEWYIIDAGNEADPLITLEREVSGRKIHQIEPLSNLCAFNFNQHIQRIIDDTH